MSVSLSPSGSQSGAAGLQLLIYPASRADFIDHSGNDGLHGFLYCEFLFRRVSIRVGSVGLLVYAYDDEGNHLPEFDQEQEFQICSASASGLEQNAGGISTYPPSILL